MKRSSFFLISLLAMLIAGWAVPAQARPAADWTPPRVLFETSNHAAYPLITSDPYGTTHAFWIASTAPDDFTPYTLIYHAQFKNNTWSDALDVLMTPDGGSVAAPEVAAGADGMLHIIWHGPNNTLYYAQADARQAHDARAWSKPIPVATSLSHAGITVSPKGWIYIAFPDAGEFGVSFTVSKDGGQTFSSPLTVAAPQNEDVAADYARVVVDADERIHVVWTEFFLPSGWPPYGVFYTRSEDGGENFSTPTVLAIGDYDQAMLALGPDQSLHAVWNGAVNIGGRYYASSSSHGASWSATQTVTPLDLGGTSGYPDMGFDSNGRLHLVTPLDLEGGIVYTTFGGERWNPFITISGKLKDRKIKSIELSRMTISAGNRLHVIFENGFQDIYTVSLELNALPQPPEPTPTNLPPTPSFSPQPTSSTTPRTARVNPAAEIINSPASSSPWLPLAAGILAPLALVAGAAFWRLGRGRRE